MSENETIQQENNLHLTAGFCRRLLRTSCTSPPVQQEAAETRRWLRFLTGLEPPEPHGLRCSSSVFIRLELDPRRPTACRCTYTKCRCTNRTQEASLRLHFLVKHVQDTDCMCQSWVLVTAAAEGSNVKLKGFDYKGKGGENKTPGTRDELDTECISSPSLTRCFTPTDDTLLLQPNSWPRKCR